MTSCAVSMPLPLDLKGESDRALGMWATEQAIENEGQNQGKVDQPGPKDRNAAALRVLAEADGRSLCGAAAGTRPPTISCFLALCS